MTNLPNPTFEADSAYRRLAHSLDALPNRFPAAEDESELRLLAYIFTPAEADLAAQLHLEKESPQQIAARLGRDVRELMLQLKEMTKKGLIAFGKTAEGRPGFGILPFVVGIYEEQIGRIDAEMAQLFEAYYRKSFSKSLTIQPQVHRVIPVGVSIKNNMEVHPFESVNDLLDNMQSWGVLDCICRTQKKLIGDPCQHPIDVCMAFSTRPDQFAEGGTIHPLTRAEAQQTLQRAADAGLVHCVSNNQQDVWYICNCCTCSCAVLRGMAELGIANVVARSAFLNVVDESLCLACGACVEVCQFTALTLDDVVQVNEIRCVGCGVCVPVCPNEALHLVRRVDEAAPPVSEEAWRAVRVAEKI